VRIGFCPCRWHNSTVANAIVDGSAVLRQRLCGHLECRSIFTICVSCDRGQRYCSPTCRAAVRRQQRREANRRYQQSEPGRASHRRCQQRYRLRAQAAVTDQGAATITLPTAVQLAKLCRCTVCGQHGRWIDPFPTIPRRWRRGWCSKNYVFR